jgi:hypothetical protein
MIVVAPVLALVCVLWAGPVGAVATVSKHLPPKMTVELARQVALKAGPKMIPPDLHETKTSSDGFTQIQTFEYKFERISECKRGLGERDPSVPGCRLWYWVKRAETLSDDGTSHTEEHCDVESSSVLNVVFIPAPHGSNSAKPHTTEGFVESLVLPHNRRWAFGVTQDTPDRPGPPGESVPC